MFEITIKDLSGKHKTEVLTAKTYYAIFGDETQEKYGNGIWSHRIGLTPEKLDRLREIIQDLSESDREEIAFRKKFQETGQLHQVSTAMCFSYEVDKHNKEREESRLHRKDSEVFPWDEHFDALYAKGEQECKNAKKNERREENR